MIIYGKQVCLYALEHHPESVQTVYLAKKGLLSKSLFDANKSKIKFLEEKWAQSMSKGGNHQGILLEIDEIEQSTLSQIKKNDFIVVLDGLTDTGNIGAIIRSAYALGAEAVIAAGVKQLNLSAIARTSSGALLDMPFMIVPNILDLFNELGQVGFILYGASMEGEEVQNATFETKRVLVLGSEGEGLSKKARSKINHTISIKMKHAFDSLNVSAAAAILIHRMSYAVK
ncbi:MAG: 23S rRNA (guanosine(2251)-2'-O)-methyltransferase RlmB [Campylobacterales bacterium]|nr:23S rRNA (guanosine(2251)-2'-O)-methyltransferase RlmB [Campylobacterales bacterium]